ncbi:MAG TPA: hypothetical protein PKI55_16515 [Chitinophagaceae bacterium]|nr:hypothetical protein [Chitinophagaceae bacterium]
MRNVTFFFWGAFFLLLLPPKKDPVKKHTTPKSSVSNVRWTGRLTLEERVTGPVTTSVRNVSVSFVNALPTLNRDDETIDPDPINSADTVTIFNPADPNASNLNFTDDKGTGNVTLHSELYIGGKKAEVTDCSGGGKAELHEVAVDEYENIYRIHAIGPGCTGTTTFLLDGGRTEVYGPEFTDIIVSDERLTTKNVLAGTRTTMQDMGPGLGTVTTTITWHLARESSEDELIITPENYNDWMPEPGTNELIKGSTIKIGLKVHGQNGRPLTSRVRSFEVKLSNTSREPGITLNAPLTPLTTLPDLQFLPQSNTGLADEFQSATIQCTNGESASIVIAAFDGGAYTTLTAEAVMQDNSRLTGHLLISGGNTETPIPKRPANSKIAEKWLIAHNNPADLYDDESSAGNSNNGDGLTAYEEYRGVIARGRHKRLEPDKKELGVIMKPGEAALFRIGIEWLENATGLKVIRFDEGEIGTDRRLNKNFETAHSYDQYALRLLQKHVRRGVWGRAEGGPGLPKDVIRVKVDYNQIAQWLTVLEREAQLSNISVPFNLEELVAKTVAHELGHGVSIPHHGNQELNQFRLVVYENDPVRIYRPRASGEITNRPDSVKGLVGKQHNQQSGDIFCIMCYNPCFDYSLVETGNFYKFYIVPLLPVGSSMCNDPAGVDINASPYYFGDAEKGNCLSRIKLK